MNGAVSALRVDGRVDPLGLDSPAPEFSWRLTGDDAQSAYRIQVSADAGFDGPLAWDPGWVQGDAPYGISYAGDPLRSRTRYSWRVRVRHDRTESAWSAPAVFETGLLEPDDWTAHWITDSETHEATSLCFRAETVLAEDPARARAYVSALGWYRLHVNGVNVTDTALVPRFTPFDDYVEYQVHDLGGILRQGVNVIGIEVSEGRFRGRLGAFSKPARFGDRLAAIAQLEWDDESGGSVFVTDESWTVGEGRILTADPKFGERVDLRIDDAGWLQPGGRPLRPRAAALLPPHPRALVAEEVERVQQVGTLDGVVSRTPGGTQLIDFGQNINGYARLRLAGPPGSKVVVSYSELLDPDGELATDYLHFQGVDKSEGWFQRDEITLPGGTVEYAPSFAVRGFRYVAVDGDVAPLIASDAEAVIISTAVSPTGEFECSEERLNRLWLNSRWSMVGNFADTPTDCPTRERSGWTGDIQVFGPTAAILADTDAYLRRYLRNVAADQYPDGTVPPVIPAESSSFVTEKDRLQEMARTSVGWGDVTVMLPWTLYQYFGDRRVLEKQYESGRAWVEFLERRAKKMGAARRLGRRVGELEQYIVDTGFNWGEWLRPGEGPASQMAGNLLTGRPEVATAYFANSARLLGQIAGLLAHEEDAVRFDALAGDARAAYNAAFVKRGGARIGADRQDDYVRALAFDLLPADMRPVALERLVELIDANGGHLDTGFLSTGLLLPVLSDGGRSDVAWRVILNETAPSWLAQIGKGATTIWESWEGYAKDGRPNDSHNHYAYGTVVRWLHEHVGGLRPLEPGYRRFLVAPEFGDLEHARTAVVTPYGRAAAAWRRTDAGGVLTVHVPAGTRAVVRVPGVDTTLESGRHELTWS